MGFLMVGELWRGVEVVSWALGLFVSWLWRLFCLMPRFLSLTLGGGLGLL